MGDRLKWIVALGGIVAFTVLGLTALDRYDEETCRQIPTWTGTLVRNPAHDPMVGSSGPPFWVRTDPEVCDGFLPW